ncbi:MAG: hypothetical protein IPH43_09170 [Xanthomonadales bacterium]|uniref:hypothetical protein n=1 Tax=Dokdonella sp. TaxID=2291710 RepID=UPI002CECF20C|nr:hypothetical protein [Xanthomonadales bacterium]HQW77281.1 hypothetical protein [Dokdonella sp.]MBK7012807.1 hypothetical protein [Xanthomonadales bacterium]MBK7210338.1 hypothetical protein [Xanthomonadales bacterium]MBL0223791.1 hypothetical protein [Xanthomonadales bacterium]
MAFRKRIPYRQVARLHRLIPLAFPLLVFHCVVLMPAASWRAPRGPLAALLMACGVVAALLSLSGRIGFTRRAPGHVASLRQHEDRLHEVDCHGNGPGRA